MPDEVEETEEDSKKVVELLKELDVAEELMNIVEVNEQCLRSLIGRLTISSSRRFYP